MALAQLSNRGKSVCFIRMVQRLIGYCEFIAQITLDDPR